MILGLAGQGIPRKPGPPEGRAGGRDAVSIPTLTVRGWSPFPPSLPDSILLHSGWAA